MDIDSSLEILLQNQDLLRASVQDIGKEAISRALQWLHGEAPYPYPTSIHLNLTLRCTARCIHCKQWTWPNHSEFTRDEIERLFQIFSSWGVKAVTLAGGNPLLHEHIGFALKTASEAGMQVGIISEGVVLSTELAEAISQHAKWIRFSLDGPKASIHDGIRNRPGLFNLVNTSIGDLRNCNSPIQIGLNCVVQKRNLSSLSQMIDFAQGIGVDILLFKLAHGNDPRGRYLLSAEEWGEFVKWVEISSRSTYGIKTNLSQLNNLLGTVFREKDALEGRPVRSFYMENKVRCFAPLFFLTCDSEGNLYPCDYLQADTRQWDGQQGVMRNEFRLGNVLHDTQAVLENLSTILRNRVHGLPASGYDECGCCTRFCQINSALTKIDGDLRHQSISSHEEAEYLTMIESKKDDTVFL